MLKYILNYLFPKEPFDTQKPKKYVTTQEYDLLTDRQKVLLHAKYNVYEVPHIDVEVCVEEED